MKNRMRETEETPPPSHHLPLTAFRQCWLVEAFRLLEESGSVQDDTAVVDSLRQQSGMTDQTLIIQRALRLPDGRHLLQTLRRWVHIESLLGVAIMLFALLSGYLFAAAALGDGTRAVNITITLAVLLGMHFFSLLLWLAGLWLRFFSRSASGSVVWSGIGGLCIWLMRHVGMGGSRGREAQALFGLMRQNHLLYVFSQLLSHLWWLFFLSGVIVGLLILLSAKHYSFVWQTTILSTDFFVYLVRWLGWLPGKIGFVTPDMATIAAAGLTPPDVAGAVTNGDAGRIAWSYWLIGCLFVYGVCVRLILSFWYGAGCLWKTGHIRLDLDKPYYSALLLRLQPYSEPAGIVDEAPTEIMRPHWVRDVETGTGSRVVVGIELSEDRLNGLWPPAWLPQVNDLGVIDSRAQRSAIEALLQRVRPGRLLLVCDAGLTPDRGVMSLLVSLAGYAQATRILLLPTVATAAQRQSYWQEMLLEMGMAADAIYHDTESPRQWLLQQQECSS